MIFKDRFLTQSAPNSHYTLLKQGYEPNQSLDNVTTGLDSLLWQGI